MPEKPRVRFAPSPTGELHVGNARTALFNWLFARHYEGTFILRIEDTDRERTSKRFEDAIIDDLKWLSIDWDEGPEKDGAFGPYHQFDRLDIYRDYLQELIAKERVYPCYCTDEELEEERANLIAMRRMPRYMGKCRNLSATRRKEFEEKGRKPAYRFNAGKEIIEFKDLIRGNMRFDSETIGDFIIVRSNGIPAYNFAVVIDDHLMKVSHVIRGEDHLSNTALQMLLYRALEYTPPRFAHHSLILGKDRSKLSKRHGSVTVREFREKGFLPEAFLNYMSLLGSSFGGGKEVCPMEEIIRDFTLERAGKSGAIFDEHKLQWLNGIYIRNYKPEKLMELLKPIIIEAGYDYESLDKAWLSQIVESLRDNITALSDVGEYIDMFFDDRYELSHDARSLLAEDEAMKVLPLVRDTLERSKEDLKDVYADLIDTVREQTGLKGRKLFMPIRAAVTGRLTGPELDKIFAILGRESILRRIDTAIQNRESPSET
jgi:nondiscriminating glutamyl-tRNA synthetase